MTFPNKQNDYMSLEENDLLERKGAVSRQW